MRLLLDTHAFVWALTDDPRVGREARRLLATEAEQVLVSVLALWEIALKAALGRMPVRPAQAEAAIAASGYRRRELTAAHVLAFPGLPLRRDHRDPFDRMLLAQAQQEGLTVMTADAQFAGYGVPVIGCG